MSKLVFRLRNVPDDEAQDVREILQYNDIEFFETFAGNWGVSLPAIWITEETQYARARQLIDSYQEERRVRIKMEYEQSVQRGEAKTMWHSFHENPLRFVLFLSLASLVLLFSIKVFLSL